LAYPARLDNPRKSKSPVRSGSGSGSSCCSSGGGGGGGSSIYSI